MYDCGIQPRSNQLNVNRGADRNDLRRDVAFPQSYHLEAREGMTIG
jgi:hypothetical protein